LRKEKYWIQTFVFGVKFHIVPKKKLVPNSMTFWKKKKKLPKSRKKFQKEFARFLYRVQVGSQKNVRMWFFFPYFVNNQNLAKLAYWWSPPQLHQKIGKNKNTERIPRG
jgi:hypothetical protein